MKNFKPYFFLLFFSLTLLGCKSIAPRKVVNKTFPEFLIEGHRGTRGLMPENTIPSMLKAIEAGANVLELDVHISKDKKVVVAHDPYFNRNHVLLPGGEEIPKEDSLRYILYQMDYKDISLFDVGSIHNTRFPLQENFKTHIPLLGELIDSVETYTLKNNLPGIIYNIEIKSNPSNDDLYHPKPPELVRLVVEVLKSKDLNQRFYIQSFDIREIQEVRKNYPNIPVGFLTGNQNESFENSIAKIGFLPEIYSPHFNIISKQLIEKCHKQGVKIVPWTVNSKDKMIDLIKKGVDGIITDFPDLLKQILDSKSQTANNPFSSPTRN